MERERPFVNPPPKKDPSSWPMFPDIDNAIVLSPTFSLSLPPSRSNAKKLKLKGYAYPDT